MLTRVRLLEITAQPATIKTSCVDSEQRCCITGVSKGEQTYASYKEDRFTKAECETWRDESRDRRRTRQGTRALEGEQDQERHHHQRDSDPRCDQRHLY